MISHVIKTAESVGDNNFLMKSTPIYVCLCTVCKKVNEELEIFCSTLNSKENQNLP
jgi:hypothetical protein